MASSDDIAQFVEMAFDRSCRIRLWITGSARLLQNDLDEHFRAHDPFGRRRARRKRHRIYVFMNTSTKPIHIYSEYNDARTAIN
jgi:hypothetical protein